MKNFYIHIFSCFFLFVMFWQTIYRSSEHMCQCNCNSQLLVFISNALLLITSRNRIFSINTYFFRFAPIVSFYYKVYRSVFYNKLFHFIYTYVSFQSFPSAFLANVDLQLHIRRRIVWWYHFTFLYAVQYLSF